MTLKVEITHTDAKLFEGTSKTGKPYAFKTQKAYIWTIDPETKLQNMYPTQIDINLDKEENPLAVGFYQLDLSSIYVDRSGRLSISPRLKPYPLSKAELSAKAAA